MTGLVRNNMPDDRHAREGQIADEIKNFVPHEFVGIPKAFLVQNRLLAEDYGTQRTTDIASLLAAATEV